MLKMCFVATDVGSFGPAFLDLSEEGGFQMFVRLDFSFIHY